MTAGGLTVCGISGSLRRESLNRKLLQAAAAAAPADIDVVISDRLADMPLFNEDLVGQEPAAVVALREDVAAADALLIATPEYNGGAPGVLKNALDWLSIPLGRSVLEGKLVALIGATPGRLGTARGQFELRHTFVCSRSLVVPGPEVLVSFATEHFDDAGRLTDPVALDRLAALFANLRKYSQVNKQEVVLNS